MLNNIDSFVSKIKKGGREKRESSLKERIALPVHNRVKLVFTFIWSKVKYMGLGTFEIAYYLENDTIIALMIFL